MNGVSDIRNSARLLAYMIYKMRRSGKMPANCMMLFLPLNKVIATYYNIHEMKRLIKVKWHTLNTTLDYGRFDWWKHHKYLDQAYLNKTTYRIISQNVREQHII